MGSFTSSSYTVAVVHILADDSATLYFNNKLIGEVTGGWGNTNYSKMPVTVVGGTNVVLIVVKNVSNTGAVIASVIRSSDNEVLLRTDASWNPELCSEFCTD